MSQVAMVPPGVSLPSSPLEASTVSVPVERLLEGHQLREAVHDGRGVLLLAAGSTITSRFKELLRKRGDRAVSTAAVDAQVFAEARTRDVVDGPASDPGYPPATRQLVAAIEQQVEGGGLLVKNTGPPLADRVRRRGRVRYDGPMVELHRFGQRAHAHTVGDLMGRVHGGSRVESHPLMTAAAETLDMLIEDADCAVATALNDLDRTSLSDHALRTSILAMAIGIETGFDDANVQLLGLCGLIHDWGMCKVRPSLLETPETLHAVDFLEIKKHPIRTLEMLQNVSGLPTLAGLVCYQVHERPDGGGYPRGRKTPQIHPFARILHVADTFSALLGERPYRDPLMPAAAMECLLALSAEDKLDADAVRRTVAVLSMFPPGSWVQLADGRIARVLRRNGHHTTAPILEVLAGRWGDDIDPDSTGEILDPLEASVGIKRAIPRADRVESELSGEDIDRSRR
jgi:HD-GYP domain-containing protein (c-di-GMP phosphodiesterase class II)